MAQLILKIRQIGNGLKYSIINTKVSSMADDADLDEKAVYGIIEKVDIIHLAGDNSYIELSRDKIDRIINGKLSLCADAYSGATVINIGKVNDSIRIETMWHTGDGKNTWEQTSSQLREIVRRYVEGKQESESEYYIIRQDKTIERRHYTLRQG